MNGRPDDDNVGSGDGGTGPDDGFLDEIPKTDLSPIVDACESAAADAFVAIGDRFDADLRYLTRFSGPDRPIALIVIPGGDEEGTNGTPAHGLRGRAVLCAPAPFRGRARREFVADARTDGRGFHDDVAREIRIENVGEPAGRRAVAVVDDLIGDRAEPGEFADEVTVLVPQSIPHDAAVYLERAGATIASTNAVDETRVAKTDAEIDRLRRVQHATARGMARAETVLAESEVVSENAGTADDAPGSVLVRNGERLTTERLRREVNATLADDGIRDTSNTVIGAGATAVDLHFTGVAPIRPGEAVLVDVSPRGPHGYYGDMTRTFVVDGDGGWERRAYVAVEAAREAALAEIEPGVLAETVHREAAAELAAYGFDPNASDGESGFTHGTGHGVGLSLHEAPSLPSDTELQPGHVVTVEPGVYDPVTGGVRLEDLVAVTEDGYEILAEYPFGTMPESRELFTRSLRDSF